MVADPIIEKAVANTKIKAVVYNTNFDNIVSFVKAGITEMQNLVNSYMPSQTGNAGKVLKTDGTSTSWEALPTDDIIDLGTKSSGTVTLTADKMHKVTFSGATTIALPTGLTSGVHYNCAVIVTMSSAVTITQPTVTWVYGIAPSMTSTTAKYRLIYETVDGGSTWLGYWAQLGT